MNAIIVVGSSDVGVSASWNSAMGLAESCRSSYAYGSIAVHSCELGCCFDRRVMRLKAASAVETHRRQPHFVPVRVVASGRGCICHFEGRTSSSSLRMLMAAWILVLCAQKNGEFD